MSKPDKEIRCETCNQLIAKVYGMIIYYKGKKEDDAIKCPRCGLVHDIKETYITWIRMN